MKQVLFTVSLLLLFVSCTPLTNTESAASESTETHQPAVEVASTAVVSTSVLQETEIPLLTNTAQPSSTLVIFPDYSSIPPLAQLVITKEDICLATNSLPIYPEYHDFQDSDITSSADQNYCETDCVRRSWSVSDGANFTYTIVRTVSPRAAGSLLKDEVDRVEQLYSDRTKYAGVAFEDPYTGEGDTAWAGYPQPGFTAHAAVARSSVVIIMEWTRIPKGIDLEFNFDLTNEFVRIQFEKIDNALGTPFAPTSIQSICTP